MKKKQHEIFLDFEADNYYKRNKETLLNLDFNIDFPIKLMHMYELKPKRVLEIGCCIGSRLNYINKELGSYCVGIDPSKEAVLEGKKLFNNIKIKQGIFSNIPLNEKFDLVIINFVFHWIDRELLARCVSEVDRVLAMGGYVIIGDFFPGYPKKNRYHHLSNENLWTYKQNYSNLFLSLEHYLLIAFFTTTDKIKDKNNMFQIEFNNDDRIFYSLLMKKYLY